MTKQLPFTRWYNLNDQSEIDIFAEQIRGYISFVYRGNETLAPNSRLDSAWEIYGLRCHLFDYLAKCREIGRITNEEFAAEIKTACRILFLALRTDYANAVERLHIWHQYRSCKGRTKDRFSAKGGVASPDDFFRRLAIVRCAQSEMRPMDNLGWFNSPQAKKMMMMYDPTSLDKILHEVTYPRIANGRESEPTDNVRLTVSQKQILELLNSFWVMKRGKSRVASISARTIPLIIAPSGTGKSFIVRHFAESNSLPLLSLDSGAWIVNGAYTQPSTITTIKHHVAKNPAGVILVDELDKFAAQTDWGKNVQQEVYSLLDGGLRGFESFTPEEKAKLNECFLAIGCGTWHSVFEGRGKTMGFGSGSDFSVEQEIVKQAGIPHELLARFNSNLLVLKPPTESEFRDWICEIHDELEIDPPMSVDALSQSAVASGMNNRWLEAYVSRLLLNRTRPKFDDGQVYLTDANNKDSDRLGHP